MTNHELTRDEYELLKTLFVETIKLPCPELPSFEHMVQALDWGALQYFCVYTDLFKKPEFDAARRMGPEAFRRWLLSDKILRLLFHEGYYYDCPIGWISAYRNPDALRKDFDPKTTPEVTQLIEAALQDAGKGKAKHDAH